MSGTRSVIPFFVAVLVMAGGFWLFQADGFLAGKDVGSGEELLSKYDRMDLAMQQEYAKTFDPSTGTVPRERLLEVEEYIRKHQNSRAAISGINWVERGPDNVGGRTRAMMFDPNDNTYKTVYAGSVGGGLWKTTDITAAQPVWNPVNDLMANLAVTTLAYDPSNTNTWYLGTGEGWYNLDAIRGDGIFKTTNGGTTWTQLSSTTNSNFYYVQKIVVTSSGTVLAATRTGIFRSTNGGSSWTNVKSGRAADLEIAANGDIFASIGIFTTDGIYKSTDDGATWSKLTSGLPSSGYERIELACAPSDANRVYALFCDAATYDCYGIYKTTNGGSSWTAVTNPNTYGGSNFANQQAWYNLIAAVDPNNPDRVYIGGLDVLVSSNAGSSWTEVSQWYGGGTFQYMHADQHMILFQPNSSSVIYFGNDGGIYSTTNGNTSSPTLKEKLHTYDVTQFYACAMHPDAYSDYFLAGAQDNGSHRFNSAGYKSTVEVTGGDGAFCHIDQNQPNYQFTQYVYNNYYRSTDGGKSFSQVINNNNGVFINPSDYDNSANKLYAAYTAGKYLRWDNPQTGTTTKVINAGFTGYVSAVTVDPNTANRVWFGTGYYNGINGSHVYKVDNAHTNSPTVTDVTPPSMPAGSSVSCIEIENGNANHVLVTYSNYGVTSVWETTDGGSTWTSVEGNLPDMPVRWALFNPNNSSQALLATELGVWSTDNLNGTSTNWAASNTGLANVRVDMLQYRTSDKLVIAATHGRGLYSTDIFTTVHADFDADKIVTYTGKSVTFTDASYKATSWSWNFGDGGTSTLKNPSHSYASPGRYSVTLSINSGASSKTRTNYILVLPNRGTPYLPADGGNFDVNPNDFGADTIYGSKWERGQSTVSGKQGTFSGSYAWVIDISSSNYKNRAETYLYTPNFKMTASGTYTIKFRSRYKTESGYDGFRVEYSLDKGDTWTYLGTVTANWYNTSNNLYRTAFPINEPYFSGNHSSSFALYSYDMSSLAGNNDVAFRFAFKTDNSVTDVGVAIDEFEITGPSNLLPVNLLTFNAYRVNQEVQVTWQSGEELNLDKYVIQRSRNARDFEDIASVNAGKDEYQYLDGNAPPEALYYRLKMVDEDGSAEYSDIRQVAAVGLPANALLVFPNPVSNWLTIKSSGNLRGDVQVEIFSINGQKALGPVVPSGMAGRYRLNVSDLKPGVYFLVWQSGTYTEVQRFLKH